MTTRTRRRLTACLGLAGGVLGVLAGLIQIVAGTRLPEWTGAKLDTGPLGLLTIALSLLAGLAAHRQARPDLTVLGRAACAFGLIGPGLLGLSTVGRVWYLPAVLLVVAGGLTIDSWRATGLALIAAWPRVLLSMLGACEVLMAAGSSSALLMVGTLGGITVMVAAWLPTTRRWVIVFMVGVGVVPFALLGWTAVVPLLVLVVAAWLTTWVVQDSGHAH